MINLTYIKYLLRMNHAPRLLCFLCLDYKRQTPLHLIRWGPGSHHVGGTAAAEFLWCFKPSEADENWGSTRIKEPWTHDGIQTIFRVSLYVTVQPLWPLDAVLTPWSFHPFLPLELMGAGWLRILWETSPQWLRLGGWGDTGGTLQGHWKPLGVH